MDLLSFQVRIKSYMLPFLLKQNEWPHCKRSSHCFSAKMAASFAYSASEELRHNYVMLGLVHREESVCMKRKDRLHICAGWYKSSRSNVHAVRQNSLWLGSYFLSLHCVFSNTYFI